MHFGGGYIKKKYTHQVHCTIQWETGTGKGIILGESVSVFRIESKDFFWMLRWREEDSNTFYIWEKCQTAIKYNNGSYIKEFLADITNLILHTHFRAYIIFF